jgi:hypothetical protein
MRPPPKSRPPTRRWLEPGILLLNGKKGKTSGLSLVARCAVRNILALGVHRRRTRRASDRAAGCRVAFHASVGLELMRATRDCLFPYPNMARVRRSRSTPTMPRAVRSILTADRIPKNIKIGITRNRGRRSSHAAISGAPLSGIYSTSSAILAKKGSSPISTKRAWSATIGKHARTPTTFIAPIGALNPPCTWWGGVTSIGPTRSPI